MGLENIRQLATGTFKGEMPIHNIVNHPVFRNNLNQWGLLDEEKNLLVGAINAANILPNISALRKSLSSGTDINGVNEESRILLKRLFLKII